MFAPEWLFMLTRSALELIYSKYNSFLQVAPLLQNVSLNYFLWFWYHNFLSFHQKIKPTGNYSRSLMSSHSYLGHSHGTTMQWNGGKWSRRTWNYEKKKYIHTHTHTHIYIYIYLVTSEIDRCRMDLVEYRKRIRELYFILWGRQC